MNKRILLGVFLIFLSLIASIGVYADYRFVTLAGTAPGNADGSSSVARFNHPTSVARDNSGNLYVADATNHTIRKITPSGVVSTIAGSAGLAGSADGSGSAARFNNPRGIAVDLSSGDVYVSDTSNNTIRKITGSVVTTFAGTPNVSGHADGNGSAAQFNGPCGLAVDSSGNVYVADSFNYEIRKITPLGDVTTFAGSWANPGSDDNAVGTLASFSIFFGLTIDSNDNLYVADTGNFVVRKVTPVGVVTTFAGSTGTKGHLDDTGTAAIFSEPTGITVDADFVYVADLDSVSFENHTVRKIALSGVVGQVTTFAGSVANVGSADGTGAAAEFNSPAGLVADGAGKIYVADSNNHTIRAIDSGGIVTTFVGVASFGSDDGVANVARFKNPQGIAIDDSYLYVADADNNKIRRMDLTSGVFITLAGSGNYGSGDGSGLTAEFNGPQALAVDGSGNLYVADKFNDSVRKITAAGAVTTLPGIGSWDRPSGIAVDTAGNNVYVSDTGHHRIRRIDLTNGTVTTVAGTGLAGTSDGAGTAASFNSPEGLVMDSGGNLYVADRLNNAIRKMAFNGSVWNVSTLAGIAGATSGHIDGVGGAATFWEPRGMAVDPTGNIYVTDSQNYLVRKISALGAVSTQAGTAGLFGPNDGIGAQARFNAPVGIAVSASTGRVYVADGGSNTIRNGNIVAEIKWPVPSAIVPNEAIGSARLNATAVVPGTLDVISGAFVYNVAASTTFGSIGAQLLTATFTPSDTLNITSAVGEQSLVVATPTVIALGNLNVVYDGNAHAVTAATTPNSLSISITYNGLSTPPTQAGSYAVVARINDINYAGTASNTLTIAKAAPLVTWIAPSSIVYGTALSVSQLNASSSVAGTFNYTPAVGAVLSGGTQTLTAVFTPNDTVNYSSVSSQQSLMVVKAAATITLNGLNATYDGNSKSVVAVTTPSSLSVGFTYNGSSTAPSAAGGYTVVGTINDVNYGGSATGTLNIAKASPVVVWSTPAPINYGTALDTAQLNASTAVAGTFLYSPTSGTVLNTGTQALSTTFTPTDTANYNSVQLQRSLIVNKATPAITWSVSSSIVYGTALSNTQLSAVASVSGSFSYNPANGAVLDVGVHTLNATFTPSDTSNFNSATSQQTLAVSAAGATIALSNLAVTYDGSAHALTAATTPVGLAVSFTYNGSAVVPSAVGSYVVNATINNHNYTGNASAMLTISKATPVINWPTPAAIDAGTALSGTQLNATISVPGTFSYDPAVGTILDVGIQALHTTFTPADSTNYASVTASATIQVRSVNSVPVFTIHPASQSSATGFAVALNASAEAIPAPTYQWQKEGINISGATASSYIIQSLSAGDVGLYRVIASNSVGSTASNSASITMHPLTKEATAASDFNSDGKADVIWQNRVTGERYIYLMNGANFLAGASLGTVGLDWNAAATGDFNGDGKTDVVWENRVTGERYIYLMSGTTFMSGVNLGTVPPEWWIVVAADFNGDGKTDIIWENRLTGEHYLYLMNGTTVSSAVDLGTVSLEWTMGGAGDFTGDGKPDLLWQNIATGEQKVQAMNGTVPGAYTMLGTYYDLQIAGSGDFNNDGKADILLTNLVTGERTIRLMNGVTPLGTASLGTVGFEWVLNRQVPLRVPVDFNADGRSDVVWQNNVTGERYVYLMNGVSFNSGYTLILPASIDWKVAASADFNRDGKPDLVGENIVTGERCIWLMNAGTVNSTVSLGTTATQWSIAAATDMNSDGQPDVVWQNTSTGARRIDLMNGTTVSSTITLTLPASNQWRIAATADFNRDGKPDLVGQNTTSGESCIWLMNGSTVNATVTLGAAVGSQWSIATTVDLNSDGYPDVLWQNTVTGERYIYLMNYYTFVSAVSLGTIPTAWAICR